MEVKLSAHFEELSEKVRLSLDEALAQTPELSDAELRRIINRVIAEGPYNKVDFETRELEIFEQTLVDNLIGLGPLGRLLRDENISEIMVNRFNEVFIEINGEISKSGIRFGSELALRTAIERIVAPLGRRIDASSPMVDARLSCGSRVNAVLPPVSLNGACLTIRKFNHIQPDLAYLISQGSCSPRLSRLLKLLVESRCNIVVSGGTGSGKTTLLNALSGEISRTSRVITIEDSAELKIDIPNLIRLEARPANQEGKGQISIRQLLSNALRMRPDRIIVGECRGSESLDMLQAMNTGHSGSMTTLHANSPSDALRRLETLVLMADTGIPVEAVRAQVLSAIQIVIQTKRLPDGRRVISDICELQGNEGGQMQLATLAEFNVHSSKFHMTGEIPKIAFSLSQEQRDEVVLCCRAD